MNNYIHIHNDRKNPAVLFLFKFVVFCPCVCVKLMYKERKKVKMYNLISLQEIIKVKLFQAFSF